MDLSTGLLFPGIGIDIQVIELAKYSLLSALQRVIRLLSLWFGRCLVVPK